MLLDETTLKRVSDELTCPICLEVAQLPVNFTCFRGCGGRFSAGSTCLRSVLCMHCANEALQLGRPPPSRFPDSRGFAHCLICRETRVDSRMLTPDNAHTLNHNVAAIMDALGMGATCRSCNQSHDSQSALHQHYLRRCPAAVVKCRFRGCAHWHTRRAAAQHEDTCPVGRGQCGQCGAWVDRSELLRHMVASCRLRVVNCVLCSHSCPLPDMLGHLRLHQRRLQGEIGGGSGFRTSSDRAGARDAGAGGQQAARQQQGAQPQPQVHQPTQPLQQQQQQHPGVTVGPAVPGGSSTDSGSNGSAAQGGAAAAAAVLTPEVGSRGSAESRRVAPAPPVGVNLAGSRGEPVAGAGVAGSMPRAAQAASSALVGQQPWPQELRQQLIAGGQQLGRREMQLSPQLQTSPSQAVQQQQQAATSVTHQQQQQQRAAQSPTPLEVQQQAQQLLQLLMRRQQQQLITRLQQGQGQGQDHVATRGPSRASTSTPAAGAAQLSNEQQLQHRHQQEQLIQQQMQLLQQQQPQPSLPADGGAPGPLAAAAALHLTRAAASCPAALSRRAATHTVLGASIPSAAEQVTSGSSFSSHHRASVTEVTDAFAVAALVAAAAATRRSSDELARASQQRHSSMPGPGARELGAPATRGQNAVHTNTALLRRDGARDPLGPEDFDELVRRRASFWPPELDDTRAQGDGTDSGSRREGGDGSTGREGVGGGGGGANGRDTAGDEAARLVRTAAAIVRASAAAAERRSLSHRGAVCSGAARQVPRSGTDGVAICGSCAAPPVAAAQRRVLSRLSVERALDTDAEAAAAEQRSARGRPASPEIRSPGAIRRSLTSDDTELVFDVLEELVRASSSTRPGERGAARVSASGL